MTLSLGLAQRQGIDCGSCRTTLAQWGWS